MRYVDAVKCTLDLRRVTGSIVVIQTCNVIENIIVVENVIVAVINTLCVQHFYICTWEDHLVIYNRFNVLNTHAIIANLYRFS